MGTKHNELNPLTTQDFREILGDKPMTAEQVELKLQQACVVVCRPTGCIGKAKWDEPVFILRAHDLIAPFMVRQWARMFALLNGTIRNVASEAKPDLRLGLPDHIRLKHDEAMMLATSMDAWHDKKIPD